MSLQIFFHDVGHGQAVHLITPNGKTIVIDLGSSESYSPLSWLRRFSDTIDYLVVTHPHGDHISEILEIQKRGFRVGQLWRPKWLPADEVLNQNQSIYRGQLNRYLEMSAAYNSPIAAEKRIGNPSVTGGVSIETFASRDCGMSNINNHSGVVVVKYCGVTVVVPGDNEAPSWRGLLANPGFARAAAKTNIFMASHHGRQSGYCADVFQTISPNLCIISDAGVCDTDACSRYSGHARGWSLLSRSRKNAEKRFAVTTRTDGWLHVTIGPTNSGGGYLAVSGN